MKKVFAFAVVILAVAGFFLAPKITHKFELWQAQQEQENVQLPEPEPMSSSESSVSSDSSVSSKPELNLAVPFTSQAPFANWDELHGEACEEASVLMVLRYFAGEEITGPDDAEKAIVDLVARNEALGFPVDDTAEQIVSLITSVAPSLRATLLKDPIEASIKEALNAGSLVIVPAAGRMLGNPYFSGEGPVYHMLVIRGYTKDGHVITNDPGTKRGENYVYRWSVLLDAIHDWNGGDVVNGEKVVVVVSK